MNLYRPAQAAKLANISPSSIRNYTDRYTDYFSPEATPPKGQPRAFTENDVRLLRFIAQATGEGAPHEEVAKRLADGELEKFEWWPEPNRQGAVKDEDQPQVTTLALPQELQFIARLFDQQVSEYRRREEEIQQREQDARQREHEATEKLLAAQRRIGQLEGELGALKQANRPWWQRLFGRRSSSEAQNEKD